MRLFVNQEVIFTAVEKVLREFIAIRIPGRTGADVEVAMTKLREEFSDEKFIKVFKMMTANNDPEFETFSQYEQLGTKIYFTYPYSSWER